MLEVFVGMMIPLAGTTLGVLLVLFMRGGLTSATKKILSGLAGGIMVAASVWSLLIPAIDHSARFGWLSFLPASIGFVLGFLFLMLIDSISARLEDMITLCGAERGTSLMIFAVTLHNIPEGMAVGAVLGTMVAAGDEVSFATALSLSLGIAIQNVPEGAIVSTSAFSDGMSKGRATLLGVLSGAVEPIFAALTALAVSAMLPVLPYCLAFAAGTMIYVVIEELIPDFSGSEESRLGNMCFALGFVIMMVLDVALG